MSGQGQDEAFFERLEYLLGDLAGEWRGLRREGDDSKAQDVVVLYHAVVKLLWAWGWRGDLYVDEQLPDELMPAYLVEYWQAAYSRKR